MDKNVIFGFEANIYFSMNENKSVGTFPATMTIVGAVIGAGFASGEEIWAFFGRFGVAAIVFVVPLFALLYSGFMIAFNSNASNSIEFGRIIFNKKAFIFDFIFIFCCFCLLSGMIAGMRTLCDGVPLLFELSFCVIGVLLFFGISSVLKASSLLLPILLFFLFSMSIFSIGKIGINNLQFNVGALGKILGYGILYSSMNALGALPVILQLSKKCPNKKRTAILASLIICLLFFSMLLAVIVCCKKKSAMPMLQICFDNGKIWGIVCIAILIIATATTIFSCGLEVVGFAQKFIKNRAFCVVFVLFIASMASILGFEKIVKFMYPVLGGVGILVFAASIMTKIIAKRKCNK